MKHRCIALRPPIGWQTQQTNGRVSLKVCLCLRWSLILKEWQRFYMRAASLDLRTVKLMSKNGRILMPHKARKLYSEAEPPVPKADICRCWAVLSVSESEHEQIRPRRPIKWLNSCGRPQLIIAVKYSSTRQRMTSKKSRHVRVRCKMQIEATFRKWGLLTERIPEKKTFVQTQREAPER